MRKSLVKLTLSGLTATLLLSMGSGMVNTFAQTTEDEIIATVGETQITKDEFYESMKNIAGDVTLRTLILETVLEHSVEDAEALRTLADEDVQLQIEEAGGEEVFAELLAYQGLGDIEEYRYQIFVSYMFQEVVENGIDMSDEAVTDFYENTYQTMMEAQHILVETEEEANDVIARIQEGEEFDAVAQEVSLDSTAQNGGLLQPFTSGQMVPEFEEAVRSLENGAMTEEAVESEYGFHVIRTINNGEKQDLEDIREQVEEQYVTTMFSDTQFAYGIIGQLIIDSGYEIHDEDLLLAVQDLVDLANAASETPAEESTEEVSEEEATDEETEEPSEEVESEDAE